MDDTNWGDVPTWVTAIATVLAATGAFIAAYLAYQQLQEQRQELAAQRKAQQALADLQDQQSKELDQQALDRRRGQAASVFVLCDPVDNPDSTETYFHVSWKNASALPIYDVEVRGHVGTLPFPNIFRNRVMLPDDEFTESVDLGRKVNTTLHGVDIVFRDAAGVWWHNDDQGNLRERGV